MDTGYYRCEASNGVDVVTAESVVKVHRASVAKTDQVSRDGDDDYDYDDYDGHGLIPESFPLDFSADLSRGVDGLPSHMQQQFSTGGGGGGSGGGGSSAR